MEVEARLSLRADDKLSLELSPDERLESRFTRVILEAFGVSSYMLVGRGRLGVVGNEAAGDGEGREKGMGGGSIALGVVVSSSSSSVLSILLPLSKRKGV